MKVGFSHERQAVLLMLIGLGALYVLHALVTPIWMQSEEPGHFEHVLQIVASGQTPAGQPVDPAVRQSILDSMVWSHPRWAVGGQWANWPLYSGAPVDWDALHDTLSQTPPFRDNARTMFPSAEQRSEPAGYYWLAAGAVWLLRGATIEQQVIAARLVSVALSVLAVGLAYLAAAEAFPRRWDVRLAIPLLAGLLPTYVITAATVNNSPLAAVAFGWVVLASVRLLRRGFSVVDLVGLGLGFGLILWSKPTALGALPVGAAAIALALVWINRDRSWMRPALVLTGVATVLGMLALVGLDRTGGWYPLVSTAVRVPDAPDGNYVFALPAVPADPDAIAASNGDPTTPRALHLWQRVSDDSVPSLAGETVRVSLWMRSPEGPTDGLGPVLYVGQGDGAITRTAPEPVRIGVEWLRLEQTITLSDSLTCLMVGVEQPPGTSPIEYDAVQFQVAGDGANLVRNGSAERGVLLIRPVWIRLLPARLADTGVNVNERLLTFVDLRQNLDFLSISLRWIFTSFWARIAWNNPGLPVWLVGLLAISVGVAGLGVALATAREIRFWPGWQQMALALFVVGASGSVALTLLRLDGVRVPVQSCDPLSGRWISTGYYLMAGHMTLMGLWYLGLAAWIPAKHRRYALLALGLGLFVMTLAVLFGRQFPDFVYSYGVTPDGTWLMRVMGWEPHPGP